MHTDRPDTPAHLATYQESQDDMSNAHNWAEEGLYRTKSQAIAWFQHNCKKIVNIH